MKIHKMSRVVGVVFIALMASVQAEPVQPTDTGTFFVNKGTAIVNEVLIRSGMGKGNMEFTGYASFDLSGFTPEQLRSEAVSITCNLTAYMGKPTSLTVDYLGTFADGDLNLTCGAAWGTAPTVANLSSGSASAGRFVASAAALPADSFAQRFAVFRFKNPTKGVQWDLTAPTLTIGAIAAVPAPSVENVNKYLKLIPQVGVQIPSASLLRGVYFF